MKRKLDLKMTSLFLLITAFCLVMLVACDEINEQTTSTLTGKATEQTEKNPGEGTTSTKPATTDFGKPATTEPPTSETKTDLATEQKQMAILRLGEAQDNDSYIFLLDEVVWIDDSKEPNAYRIENDVEEWIPYTASLKTECHVLGPGEESAVELWRVSLDNFVSEVKTRGEDTLVEVGIYDGEIYYIAEVYHPAPLYW